MGSGCGLLLQSPVVVFRCGLPLWAPAAGVHGSQNSNSVGGDCGVPLWAPGVGSCCGLPLWAPAGGVHGPKNSIGGRDCGPPLCSPYVGSCCGLLLWSPAAVSCCDLLLRSPALGSRWGSPWLQGSKSEGGIVVSRCGIPMRAPAAGVHGFKISNLVGGIVVSRRGFPFWAHAVVSRCALAVVSRSWLPVGESMAPKS